MLKWFKKKETEKSVIERVSLSLNASCPRMVDEDTRLDETEVLDDNILVYNYTLVNVQKGSIRSKPFLKDTKHRIQKAFDTEPGFKIYREEEIIMKYKYHYADGSLIGAFSVSKS